MENKVVKPQSKDNKNKMIKTFFKLGFLFLTITTLLRGSEKNGCVDTPGLTFRDLEKTGELRFGPGMYNLADRPQDLPGEIEGWTGEVYDYDETIGQACYGSKAVKIKLYTPKK
ncbi:MAG: hypothetical protein AAB441_03130 [Patescibacteria group bacterium]